MKPVFNPMPDSLDEANKHIPKTLPKTGEEFAVMGDPSVLNQSLNVPDANRRAEIARDVDRIVDTAQLNEMIQKEKIKEDIAPTKLKSVKKPLDILKTLVTLGEYKKDVTLFDHVWTMRALEQRDLMLALDDVKDDISSQMGRVTTMMFAQVVYSIEAVDGVTIYDWFQEVKLSDYNSPEEYKIAVKRLLRRHMERMAPSLIDEFFREYTKIDAERKEALEELKN